jgi:hypothetical protein
MDSLIYSSPQKYARYLWKYVFFFKPEYIAGGEMLTYEDITLHDVTASTITCDGSRHIVVVIEIRLRPGRAKYHTSISGR